MQGKRSCGGKHIIQLKCEDKDWIQWRENGKEIDFVLVGKGNRKFLMDLMVILDEVQHIQSS